MRSIALLAAAWLCVTCLSGAQTSAANQNAAVVSAQKSGNAIAIESNGGAVTYKAVVDGKLGGNITQVCIPANDKVIARELNDIFFFGAHGEDFTLRGWTGREKCNLTCSVDLISQKPDEAVVQVNLLATGTFKILSTDETAKTELRKTHVSYKEKTVQLKRTYTFKPDRIVLNDELLWVYPDARMKTCYCNAAFMPGAIQGPARLISGAKTSGFEVTTSSGKKIPEGITYPFAAENFLKNGYKISLLTTTTSFDLGKSDMYFYEKPWQQDWNQLSGFMYKLEGYPAGKAATVTHEFVFSKATTAEMPPVVTINSPPFDARWMDEKGEMPKYKIGQSVKLSTSAVNSDGSPVPAENITWEIHIDPWWNTPPVTLHGNDISYKLPEVVNEVDKTKSKDRQLLAVFSVRVKGKNGTESVEPFAMLVGRAED